MSTLNMHDGSARDARITRELRKAKQLVDIADQGDSLKLRRPMLYRGVSNSSYSLLPSLARLCAGLASADALLLERQLANAFEARPTSFLDLDV